MRKTRALGPATAPAKTTVRKNLADAAPDFDALKVYAASPRAVTNAADDATLKTATQGLAAAVNDLGSAPPPPPSTTLLKSSPKQQPS